MSMRAGDMHYQYRVFQGRWWNRTQIGPTFTRYPNACMTATEWAKTHPRRMVRIVSNELVPTPRGLRPAAAKFTGWQRWGWL